MQIYQKNGDAKLKYTFKYTFGGSRASKFIQFHAVLGRIWQNHAPWRVHAPPGEILDPQLL